MIFTFLIFIFQYKKLMINIKIQILKKVFLRYF